MIELEAGLNTTFSIAWNIHEAKQPPKPGYTAVFVDPKWPDITSETDEIIDDIGSAPFWIEEVTGHQATCKSFELYASHYPYDVLYVSSHGGVPPLRCCKYQLVDEEDNVREVETREFEYFTPFPGERVVVSTRSQLVAVDGIQFDDLDGPTRGWAWTELIRSRREGLMPSEFHWIDNNRVEGIAFPNGVFWGPIWGLAGMGHPLVVLNCCSMWASIGGMFVHGHARACIATLWSVDDGDAVRYGVRLFKEAFGSSLVEAHHKSQETLQDSLSKRCYIVLTWPHVTMPKVERDYGLPLHEFVADQLLRTLELRITQLQDGTNPELELQICEFLASRLQQLPFKLGAAEATRRDAARSQLRALRKEKQEANRGS